MCWARWAVTFERLPCLPGSPGTNGGRRAQRPSGDRHENAAKCAGEISSGRREYEARRDREGRAKARRTPEGCHLRLGLTSVTPDDEQYLTSGKKKHRTLLLG